MHARSSGSEQLKNRHGLENMYHGTDWTTAPRFARW
jgi:hypothetical protein